MATKKRPLPLRRLRSRIPRVLPLVRGQRLIKVREVARMLGVTPPTVYTMISRGELRALYIRHMVRLSHSEVKAYARLHGEWVLRQRMRKKARGSD